MATNDSDNDGMSDVSYVMFFEPALSKTRFYVKTEAEFQRRNAEEGSNTSSTAGSFTAKHSPIGLNRLKIAKITPNATGSDVMIEYFISVGAATDGENSNTANTKGFLSNVIGGRALTGNVNKNWLPTVNSNGTTGFDLGSPTHLWKDLHLAVSTPENNTALMLDGNGKVTKAPSSRKYKKDIKSLDSKDTNKIYDLNPTSFKYKQSDVIDFGLIAEEVDPVIPELVIYDKEGKPDAVKYNALTVLLLQELKKLRQEIDDLKNEGKE